MKRQQFLTLATVLSVIILTIPIILMSNSSAQIDPTDRFFAKDFCSAENNMLDGINYITGEELSHDVTGCPVSTKIIHRWDKLSTANKVIITSRMSAQGYIDITNSIQQIQK